MNLISVEDLNLIGYYITLVVHSICLRLFWRLLKTQRVYVDTTRHFFTYEYRKLYLFKWNIYVLVAKKGCSEFITLEEFTETKEYPVIFLKFT